MGGCVTHLRPLTPIGIVIAQVVACFCQRRRVAIRSQKRPLHLHSMTGILVIVPLAGVRMQVA